MVTVRCHLSYEWWVSVNHKKVDADEGARIDSSRIRDVRNTVLRGCGHFPSLKKSLKELSLLRCYTDVTEFTLPICSKNSIYHLFWMAMIAIIAFALSRSPNLVQVKTMLDKAFS